MALTCREAGQVSLRVLGRRADEAQRLELEDHLSACRNCGQEHADALVFLRRLDALEHETLGPAARESVRRVVMAGGAPAVTTVTSRASGWPRAALGLSLAAVAAAVLVVAVRGTWRGGSVGAGDPAVAGDVRIEGGWRQGHTSRTFRTFRSRTGGRVHLPEAEVELAGATEVEWHGDVRRLNLLRGEVTVDVLHRPGQHFQVRTPAFTVQVLGTRFTVGQSGVSTARGVVHVLWPDGSIAARLGAGQSWTVGSARAPGVVVPPASPGVTPPQVTLTSTARAEVARAGPSGTPPRRQAADSAGMALRDARRLLARGDVSGARRIVVPLFQQGRDVGVEARVVHAESFLVEGRYADAVDGYQVVVRDFPGTAQAESAQFAIAQLSSEHGRRAEARAALQGYLDRYPHGRFAREAADRLARVPAR